jgi:rod shape-determining protein MreC
VAYGDNKHFEHLKLPVTWAVMAIVVGVCIFAALMLLGDRREEVEQSTYGDRSTFDSAAKPVNGALAAPVHVVGSGTSWLDDYLFAASENRTLKKQVAELRQYRDAYFVLKDVNERYEKLLNLRTEPAVEAVTARSVSVTRGPFNNNRLIDAGASRNITFGNPVITDQGLVGRIVGVSPNVSRVLMVTDVTSHVPVMVMRTDARAMMKGDGGCCPKLEFIRGKNVIKKGDQILTSGDGGIFPRGLPVGEADQGVDGVWRVRLYADRAPIDFVKVLMFKDFSRLPDADQLLKTPPVSDLLPPPALPAAATASASASASASVVVNPAAPPAASASSSSVAARPATPRPTTPRPRPAAASSSASAASQPAAQTELRPFTPPAQPPTGGAD